MAAIFKREFKSYFQSVIGWLFIAVTLCLYGLYFVVYNLSYGYAYISYSLSAITFIFLITVPVLTMRVFAEERNKKTDQLILTSPVSLGKIVFAKFLAMVAVFSIAIAVIALSPAALKKRLEAHRSKSPTSRSWDSGCTGLPVSRSEPLCHH